MLKTITKTVHMRLDELIKYVRENKKTLFKNRVEITFSTKNSNEVTFYQHGELTLDNWISSVDLFTVEVEEEITKDTEFELLIELLKKDEEYFATEYYSLSLNQILDCKTHSVYALIDGKLELILEEKDND